MKYYVFYPIKLFMFTKEMNIRIIQARQYLDLIGYKSLNHANQTIPQPDIAIRPHHTSETKSLTH